MIPKYRLEALRCAKMFVVALVALVGCGTVSGMLKDASFFVGLLIAVGFIAASFGALYYYFRGCLYLARSKGYSSAVFLLLFFALVLVLFLPDKGDNEKEIQLEKYARESCVLCDTRIGDDLKICPHCGWTQPV